VAAGIGRLHRAIPRSVLGAVEPMPFGPMAAVARVRAMAGATGVPEDPVHGDGEVPAGLALGYFETGTDERVRIRAYRRLLATFWLLMLLPGGPSYRRNPPGTLQRQASRLLELLG
jgi:hypothetical protein